MAVAVSTRAPPASQLPRRRPPRSVCQESPSASPRLNVTPNAATSVRTVVPASRTASYAFVSSAFDVSARERGAWLLWRRPSPAGPACACRQWGTPPRGDRTRRCPGPGRRAEIARVRAPDHVAQLVTV